MTRNNDFIFFPEPHFSSSPLHVRTRRDPDRLGRVDLNNLNSDKKDEGMIIAGGSPVHFCGKVATILTWFNQHGAGSRLSREGGRRSWLVREYTLILCDYWAAPSERVSFWPKKTNFAPGVPPPRPKKREENGAQAHHRRHDQQLRGCYYGPPSLSLLFFVNVLFSRAFQS